MRPSLTYPISKAAATTACLGLARNLGLRLQVLRIFQVFGEGEPSARFWPSLRLAALEGRDFPMSSGIQVRDFIPVKEVSRQFIKALSFEEVEPGKPHLRNIGSGKGQSLYDFARHWWTTWGAVGQLQPGKIEFRPGELLRLVANVRDVKIG
jgi:nucleoside-diphosphate-sugar epimerase